MTAFIANFMGLRNLEKAFREGPKIYGRAASVFLNEMAFQMKRREIVDFMSRKMTVRNRKFVEGRIRVQKARPRSNINQIMSIVGSVADKPRFTGWAEQELGRRTKKTRTMALGARRGSRKRKVLPSARMRPGKHPGPTELGIKGTSAANRASGLLAWVHRTKHRQPFRLFGHSTIEAGLFRLKGKKLVRLQHFERNTEAQPKRVRWLRGARDRYLGKLNMYDLWARSIKRVSKWK